MISNIKITMIIKFLLFISKFKSLTSIFSPIPNIKITKNLLFFMFQIKLINK